MKYVIYGADADTGEDVSLTVDAPSSEQAEAIASSRGVLVSSVAPFGGAADEASSAAGRGVAAIDTGERTMRPSAATPRKPVHASSGVPIAAPPAVVEHSGVTVNEPPGIGVGLGIAAIVCGTVGLILSWIPVVSVATYPTAGVGLLCGTVGVALAFMARGRGRNLSVAGAIISALALCIALTVTYAVAKATKDMVDKLRGPVGPTSSIFDPKGNPNEPPATSAERDTSSLLDRLASGPAVPIAKFDAADLAAAFDADASAIESKYAHQWIEVAGTIAFIRSVDSVPSIVLGEGKHVILYVEQEHLRGFNVGAGDHITVVGRMRAGGQVVVLEDCRRR